MQRDWRTVLCQRPAPMLRLAHPSDPNSSWAEREFGHVAFPDARLRPRLLQLAEAFGNHPTANIATALNDEAHSI
jgi:hypothetical protein